MDKGDNMLESHRDFNCDRISVSHNHRHEQGLRPKEEEIDCGQRSMLMTTSTSVDAGSHEGCSTPSLDRVEIKEAKKRKRKSRWDQPAETNSYSAAVIGSTNESQKINEEIPPGFSCPIRSLNSALNSGGPALQNASHSGWPSSLVTTGQPKEKFNSRLPVSYGMPWSVAQQYGTPHAEITGCWVTAPGMPFYPFPPLPPYPRDIKDCQPSNTNSMEIDQPAEVKQRDANCLVNCCSESDHMTPSPSTTGAKSEDTNVECEDAKHDSKRLKTDSSDLGENHFRQQKWNNSKIHRTWFKRNARRSNGNSSSGDMCSIDVGDASKESKVTSDSEDAICRDEKGGK